MNKNYDAIDLFKFIFSILVIIVHTYVFYEINPNINFIFSNILGRLIIPFFFISAGYFMQIGIMHKDQNYFKRYVKNLLKLYLIWSLISLPAGLIFLSHYMDLNLFTIIGGLIVGLFYNGIYYHLWYMPALIFCLIFTHLYLKKFKFKSLFILALLFYLIGLTETYYGLLNINNILTPVFNIIYTTRNGLCFGLLFFVIGIYIANNNKLYSKIKHPKRYLFILFIIFFIEAQIVRYYNLAIDYNMYITTIPFMYLFFNFLLNYQIKLNLNYRRLRLYSTLIYFSHGMYLEYVPLILGFLKLNWYDFGPFRFISVLSLTLLTSFIIEKYIKKMNRR